MSLNKSYIGLTLLRRAARKKWRAQIIRKGITFSIGTFAEPDEAAHAFDNACYYTRLWTEDAALNLNFPAIWEGAEIPKPTERTRVLVERLRLEFPRFEEEQKALSRMSETEQMERLLWRATGVINEAEKKRERILVAAISRCKMLEAQLLAEQKENKRLRDTLAGKASGITMERVVQKIPAGSVQDHLTDPGKSG